MSMHVLKIWYRRRTGTTTLYYIKIFYNEFDGWSYVVTEKPFFSSKIEFGSPDFLRDFFSTLPLHKAT